MPQDLIEEVEVAPLVTGTSSSGYDEPTDTEAVANERDWRYTAYAIRPWLTLVPPIGRHWPSHDPAHAPPKWPAAVAATRRETRHLQALAPTSVRPGQRFAVSAQLLCALTDAAVMLRPFDVPPGGRRIALDLYLRGGLRILSDATAEITVFAEQDSDPVRFVLQAQDIGPATLTLRAFAGTTYLGQLQCPLLVTEAATGTEQTSQSPPLHLDEASGRNATLEIDADPQQQVLSFRLRGPGGIGVQRPVAVAMNAPLEATTLALTRKLDALAKGALGLSPLAVERVLAGTGADLWQRLLPPSIQQALLQHLPDLDALAIVGADDPIPWELLFPVSPGKPQTFLGDQLLISRWTFDAPTPPAVIGAGPCCYVLPDAAPPAARAEIDQITGLLGTGRQIATLDALLEAIDVGGFGLLHFAAHHLQAADLPASAWVKLDQPFQQAMLGPQCLSRFTPQAPLVFMNACNSGAATPLWVGSTSWAGRFLSAGAGAFIGSLWQVRDGPAGEFAASFYSRVRAGATLGNAFRGARTDVTRAGDPTRLGYTLFGNPSARFQGAHTIPAVSETAP